MSDGHPVDVTESSLQVSGGHLLDATLSNRILEIFCDLVAALSRRPAEDLSARLHFLQDASDRGWQIPTTELAQVLQLHPKSLNRYKCYERYGFSFVKRGRSGIQSVWNIVKVTLPDLPHPK